MPAGDYQSGPLSPISGWVEDPTAPRGWRWEPDLAQMPHMANPTGVMPARTPPAGTPRAFEGFVWADGAVYTRASPAAFPDFDQVDSRRINDPGGPP